MTTPCLSRRLSGAAVGLCPLARNVAGARVLAILQAAALANKWRARSEQVEEHFESLEPLLALR